MCGGLDRRRRLETEIAALSIATRTGGRLSCEIAHQCYYAMPNTSVDRGPIVAEN